MKIRIGLGYDIHRLEEGRKLFLGGIEIDSPKGLKGHSDGDCLIHAIIDALLGALGKEDIGHHFPDTDNRYKDVRSTVLLEKIMSLLNERGMEILNIDAIVIAENPKIAPHVSRMKDILSPILRVDKDSLGIKAKTNEGLGALGNEEAIASWAQVLVREVK